MQAYLANGARLAVLLDPERRAVEVYEPDQDVRVAEPAGPVSLEPILPGFALDPAPIFSEHQSLAVRNVAGPRPEEVIRMML